MPDVLITGTTTASVNIGTLTELKAGNCISLGVTGNTVRIGVDDTAIMDKILGSAVYSINGVRCSTDGSFFIHGSECDSWGYVSGSTAWPMGEAIHDKDNQLIAGGTASGIWLTDLCPACQTCDEAYKIKQDIEQLDILVNMIKDVELHEDSVLLANKAGLEALEINGSTVNCDGTLPVLAPLTARQLLQQYITVAHMWNYAVVQNNASFKLEIAPEDTAGFVIQTKRSLPNCDGTWYIRCTIQVQYNGTMSDDGVYSEENKQALSVYVPEPSLRFKPFQMEEDSTWVVIGGQTHFVTAEDAALNGAVASVITYPDCTTKTIQTSSICGRVGGTYELNVKILPFIRYEIYDKEGNLISIRGGTVDISGQTVAGEVIYDRFVPDITRTVRQPLQNPTKEDYLNSKTAPSGSVPFNNIWQVEVRWEVGKVSGTDIQWSLLDEVTISAQNQTETALLDDVSWRDSFDPENYFEYKETKLYTCTGVREPKTQALATGSVIPVEVQVDPEE